MTTLEVGATDVPLRRGRSAFTALAAAALAVAGFVACSLVLKSLAHLALGALGLVEDSFGESAEYGLVTAASMFMVRKAMDMLNIGYNGKVIVLFFLGICLLVMVVALSAGSIRVELLVSLLQMSALGSFAYLQFWGRNRLS